MTVLRLTPVRPTDAPRAALAAIGVATLVRRNGFVYAEVPAAGIAPFARRLAFVGIAAGPCDADLRVPSGLVAAIGRDLEPLPPDALVMDVVRLERLAAGSATRELLRRRLAGILPPATEARLRCRALLRGEVALFAWSRRAWGSRAQMRTPLARRSLRPVVFDRAAVPDDELRGRAWTEDASLARWLVP